VEPDYLSSRNVEALEPVTAHPDRDELPGSVLGNRANVELPMKVLVFSGILAAGMVALGQQPQHQAISGDLQAPVSGVSAGATAQD